MKLHHVLLTAAFALCAIVSTSHAQVQLLSNTDFETAFDGNLIGNWGTFEGDASGANPPPTPALSTVFALSGAQSVNLAITGQNDAFAGVQQDVTTGFSVGDQLELSINALLDGVSGTGAEFRVEFLDAAGAFIGGQFDFNNDISGGLVDQEFTSFTNTNSPITVPTGTVTVRTVLAVQSFGGGADGDTDNSSVFFDDVTLTNLSVAVPEPASLSLVALGLVGLVARRRRN